MTAASDLGSCAEPKHNDPKPKTCDSVPQMELLSKA